MLWETGYAESLLGMMPKGYPTPVLHWVWKNPKTLTQQLADLGLTPAQINFVGFSHAHPDHIGNGSLFSGATLYIQESRVQLLSRPQRQAAVAAGQLGETAREHDRQAEGRLSTSSATAR